MDKRNLRKIYREISKEEISLKKAQEEIDEFIEVIQEAILIDGKIKFKEIGTFEILKRHSRIIANPVTKEPMKIYPKKTIKFRVSKNLKNN
ncbi:hypothetical protein F350042L8_21460 [Fusobacterium ulcerans]|uniref:HU family DNA-binding protein n=1 Tax=Fusobacterium ulcerans TaxID=861 RepID=UPI0034B51384